jgi:hypothetical protein
MIFLSACPSACTFAEITVYSTCPAACLYCDFPINISFYAFCDIVYQSLCVYLHRYSCLPVLLRVSSPVFLSNCPSACICTGIPVYLSFCLYLHRYSCLPVLSLPVLQLHSCLPVFLHVKSCLHVLLHLPSWVFLSTCPALTHVFSSVS